MAQDEYKYEDSENTGLHFRSLLESSHDFIARFDRDYRCLYVNKSVSRCFPLNQEDFIGKKCGELGFPEEKVNILERSFRKVFETGESESLELEIDYGKVSNYFDWRIYPEFNTEGKVKTIVTISREITESKKAEYILRSNEDSFRRLLDRNPVAMAVADKNGKFVHFNNKFMKTFGYTIEDIPTVDDWWPRAYPDAQYRQKVMHSCKSAARKAIKNKKETDTQEWKVTCKDGTVRDIEFRMASMQDVNIVIFNDLTGRKKAEETISHLAAIVEFSDDAIIGITLDGVIMSWNLGAKKLYGYTKVEAINHSVSMLIPPERSEEGPALREHISRGQVVDHYETVRRKKDGTLVDVALTISPVKDHGRITGASAIARDITERKKAEQLLQRLSTMDELTGLANRRAFDEFLNEEWRRALRAGHMISLMMIDVDFFKKYNDTYGHLKGDSCLKLVADVLEGVARRPGDKVARFGGEEFVVILAMTDKQYAVSIAEKIRMDIEALKILHVKSEVSNFVTVSIGVVALIPQQKMHPSDIIKHADEALYKAKNQGRNRVVVSDRI